MVEVGEAVPKVSLVDTELKKVRLNKPEKGKKTVIAFFPGAFTGVCTKEMCTFRDGMSKMNSLNANILAVSVDGPFSNKAFKEKNGLGFAVLSDYKRKAVKKFDIALKNFAGLKGYVAAKRAVFVIDNGAVVIYKWVSDDPTVEPNYAEIEAALAK